MSSVQERLQLKRVPLDKWSVKEQLCLASAVACSGDQNWMSVSRSLKTLCPSNRPSDWFSQRSCAAQYGKLLENVETPKRKKRTVSERDGTTAAGETPGELILKKLTQERILELKKLISEGQQQFHKLKEDIVMVQTADEGKLREMWAQIEAENKQKERERQTHAMWLKEREEKKLEIERALRPYVNPARNQALGSPKTPLTVKIKPEESMDVDEPSSSGSASKPGTSPLLTSLLKSPSQAPGQSQASLLHSMNQPSAAVRNLAPTITNLLTSNTSEASQFGQTMMAVSQQQQLSHQQSRPQFTSAGVAASHSTASTLNKSLSTDSLLTKGEDLLAFADLTGDSQSPTNADDNDLTRDEDQQLMEVFNGLIPDNIDELADILTDNNAIILSPDMLDDGEESILENVDSLIADPEALEKVTAKIMEDTANEEAATSETQSKNEEAPTKAIDSAVNSDEIGETKNDQTESETVALKEEQPQDVGNVKIEEDDGAEEKAELGNSLGPSDEENQTKINDETLAPTVEVIDVDLKQEEDEKELKLKEEKLDAFDNNEVIEIFDDTPKTENQSSPVKIETTDDEDNKVEPDDETARESPMDIEESTVKKEEEETTKPESEDEKPPESSPSVTEGNGIEETSCDVYDEDDNKTISDIAQKMKSHEPKDSDIEIIKSNENSVEQKMESEDDVYEEPKETIPIKVESPTHTDELPSISLIDTDDDSPAEVVKEDKKSKRDYTRKKLENDPAPTVKKEEPPGDDKLNLSTRMKLKDRDRSESPSMDEDNETLPRTRRRYSSTQNIDSVPNSPASSSEDREQKAWRKNILVVYNRLANHKNASLFNKMDELYPHYKMSVQRPMDLPTIKKNLDAGIIKSTAEFQRDIMLMCHNVMMTSYRGDPAGNGALAKEFLSEAVGHIETTVEGWRKEDKLTKPGRGRKSSRMSNF